MFFHIKDEIYSLAQMLADNKDAPDFCEWAKQAKPGDVFSDVHAETVTCVE